MLKDLSSLRTAPQPGAHAASTHAHRGQASGAQTLVLAVLNPMSLINDSADELMQSLSSRVQERSLRERRVTADGVGGALSREQAIAMLLAMQQGQAGDGAKQGDGEGAMLALARRVLGQPGQARQWVQAEGGDASSQYLTMLELVELIREGAAGPDPSGRALEALQDATAELLAEHGQAIRADLNTFDAAAQLGSAAQTQAFRSAYRDVVVGATSTAATLKHLLGAVEGGSGDDYTKVLETLRNALGLDLAAARPSTDPVRLQNLVSDLYHLKVISTVVDQSQRLSATLVKRHGIAGFPATRLAGDLVALSDERWVDASRLTRLADRCHAAEPPACRVDFLTTARQLMRELPPTVFPSPEGRQSLLDTFQVAIDQAIEREEDFE